MASIYPDTSSGFQIFIGGTSLHRRYRLIVNLLDLNHFNMVISRRTLVSNHRNFIFKELTSS